MILPYTEKMLYRILQHMANEQYQFNKVNRYGIVRFNYNDIVTASEGYFRNPSTVGNALREIESRGQATQLRRGVRDQVSIWDVAKFISGPEPASVEEVYEDVPELKYVETDDNFKVELPSNPPTPEEASEVQKEVYQMRVFLSDMLPQMCKSLDELAEKAGQANQTEIESLRMVIQQQQQKISSLEYQNENLKAQAKSPAVQVSVSRLHALEEENRLLTAERDALKTKNQSLTQMLTKVNIDNMALDDTLKKVRAARFNHRELLRRRDAILDELERYTIGASGRQLERAGHFKRFLNENIEAILKEVGLNESMPYQGQSK